MSHQEFEKLKAIYTQLIELVCYSKETDSGEERYDCFLKMFQIVRACLNFSPYTHFYTQVLIDIIIKTYNTKTFRTDLLFKYQIGVLIEDSKYYPTHSIFLDTKFKIKYVCDTILSPQERRLDVDKIVDIIRT